MKITLDVPDNLAKILQAEVALQACSVEQRILEMVDAQIKASLEINEYNDAVKAVYNDSKGGPVIDESRST